MLIYQSFKIHFHFIPWARQPRSPPATVKSVKDLGFWRVPSWHSCGKNPGVWKHPLDHLDPGLFCWRRITCKTRTIKLRQKRKSDALNPCASSLGRFQWPDDQTLKKKERGWAFSSYFDQLPCLPFPRCHRSDRSAHPCQKAFELLLLLAGMHKVVDGTWVRNIPSSFISCCAANKWSKYEHLFTSDTLKWAAPHQHQGCRFSKWLLWLCHVCHYFVKLPTR